MSENRLDRQTLEKRIQDMATIVPIMERWLDTIYTSEIVVEFASDIDSREQKEKYMAELHKLVADLPAKASSMYELKEALFKIRGAEGVLVGDFFLLLRKELVRREDQQNFVNLKRLVDAGSFLEALVWEIEYDLMFTDHIE